MQEYVMTVTAEGGELRLLSVPVLPREACSLRLRAELSPDWEGFCHKYALLWREGGELERLPLEEGTCLIPQGFAESETPFYLRLRGEAGKRYLSTNQICTSILRRG